VAPEHQLLPGQEGGLQEVWLLRPSVVSPVCPQLVGLESVGHKAVSPKPVSPKPVGPKPVGTEPAGRKSNSKSSVDLCCLVLRLRRYLYRISSLRMGLVGQSLIPYA